MPQTIFQFSRLTFSKNRASYKRENFRLCTLPYIKLSWFSGLFHRQLWNIYNYKTYTGADDNQLWSSNAGASPSRHTVGERQPRCMHFSGTTITLGKKVKVRFRRWRSANAPVAMQAKLFSHVHYEMRFSVLLHRGMYRVPL